MESKFTIAVDSIHYPGFITEKIVQAFEQHSIPVYYGSSTVDQDFNTKSFVWCESEQDIEAVVDQVIALDQNDDAYLEMLMQCPLESENQVEIRYQELEEFLFHIFEQTPEKAFRRVSFFRAEEYEAALYRAMTRENGEHFFEQLYKGKKEVKRWLSKNKLLRIGK